MKINCADCFNEIKISPEEEELVNDMITNSDHIFCSEQCRNHFENIRNYDTWSDNVAP